MKVSNIPSLIALASTMPFISMGLAGAAPITTDVQTTYPISNVVVIFQENVSFDHYFATYPNALNLPKE
ncbi:MAG TPA: hypothetical protein VE641_02775, partial [Chthoniobacterales bacterium]|nr:hypothetical protein [Chthoniobacterales bacterium]